MMRSVEVLMVSSRPLRAAARLVAAALLALLLVACGTARVVPEPDVRITAQRITSEPDVLDTITVPAGATRWVEVQYREVAASPALMFFEVQGSGVEGSVRVELRTERNQLLVATESSRRFATNVARLGGAPLAAPVERAIALTWGCAGPCLARPYQAGTYLVRLENRGSVPRAIELLAYGLEPTDPHEPNDTPATATAVLLERAGDGVSGAIEHTGDVDHFRFGCAADFVEAMRLELVSDFDRAIVLRADGSDFPPGVESDPVACGATVSVRTTDGSAGPSQHSNYAILAVPSRLYELDAVAQGLVTAAPTALGSVTLPANRSRVVRLTFPSAPQAGLRYVELGGVGVEGNVRLHVLVDGELVGVSTRRDLFAAGTAGLALSADAPADLDAVERAAIGVVWSCEGPCVAEAYRPGTVIARLTNLSSSPRTLQVFAYGTREADLNEPNDRPQDATEVTIAFEGDSVSGALERIGDVDHFRFACGAGFGDLQLTLRSEFRGDIVMRLPSGQAFGPNQPRVVPCDALVAVTTRDGTAGPSASSRYSIVVD
jgi:hypothetical protein